MNASQPPSSARTPVRDRAATEDRILSAVGTVLARDGFAAIGVNAIAREAGVDKVLIYRYFGGLPELLTQWGQSGRFWPRVEDLLAEHPELTSAPPAERYARFFEHFIDALRARPLTLEVMAAEVLHRNELTAILETEREAWGESARRLLGGDAADVPAHVGGITLLLVAGVQYLLLRSRTIRIYGGLQLRNDDAWADLKHALRALAFQMLGPPPPTAAPAAKTP